MSAVRHTMQEHLIGVITSIQGNHAFSNDEEGFMAFKNWMSGIAEKHGKEVVLPGMEPTGHYWFGLGMFLQNLGMRPVHVNPHHVKNQRNWMTIIRIKMTKKILRRLRHW